MREGVDTGDIKVIEQRLEGMNLRLDDILNHTKGLEISIAKAKGFASHLNRELEVRVRQVELDLARTKTQLMALLAVGSMILGPGVTWLLLKL